MCELRALIFRIATASLSATNLWLSVLIFLHLSYLASFRFISQSETEKKRDPCKQGKELVQALKHYMNLVMILELALCKMIKKNIMHDTFIQQKETGVLKSA